MTTSSRFPHRHRGRRCGRRPGAPAPRAPLPSRWPWSTRAPSSSRSTTSSRRSWPPEYEKQTGIKIIYEAGQRGRHAHAAHDDRRDQVGPRDRRRPGSTGPGSSTRASSTSATSPARSARSSAPGTTTSSTPSWSTRSGRRCRGATSASSRCTAPTGSRRPASRSSPTTGRTCSPPAACSRRTATRSASSSATASATTTAGSTRCSGPTAAREVDKDGKTVLIDSDETAKAVDFCRRFYKETMFEDVLGWTDVNNNKAFFGEQISCTNNASSILVVGKRDFPEIAKVTDHGLNPQGPKGRFHLLNAQSHALLTHAPGPGGGQGLPALALRRQAALALARLRRRVLRAVPRTATTTTRCGTPSRATCRTRNRSRPRACTGGLGPRATPCPRAWRSTSSSTCSPRRAGHVDQGRHRHRGVPAQADLQSEVADGRPAGTAGRAPPRSPAGRCRSPASSSARASSAGSCWRRACCSCSPSSRTRSSTGSS